MSQESMPHFTGLDGLIKGLRHAKTELEAQVKDLEKQVKDLEKRVGKQKAAPGPLETLATAAAGASSSAAAGPCAACGVWKQMVDDLKQEKQQLMDRLWGPVGSTQPTPSGKPAGSKQASGAAE